MNKLFNKIYVAAALLCCMFATSGCEAGLTYEEAPESVYSEVGVSTFTVRSRELFKDQIWAKNWNQWVEGYINTQQIGTLGEMEWTNETDAEYTLVDGTKVAPGETVTVKGSKTESDDESVPGGKVYVLNVYAKSKATYSTANKGYLFDGEKFSGEYKLVDPNADNRSQQVILPVRQNEVIGELTLIDSYNCVVERLDGAPQLGVPADFSKPARYLVKNIAYLPAGVEQYKCVYEVRITFLP